MFLNSFFDLHIFRYDRLKQKPVSFILPEQKVSSNKRRGGLTNKTHEEHLEHIIHPIKNDRYDKEKEKGCGEDIVSFLV
jgi:hypothetical protein